MESAVLRAVGPQTAIKIHRNAEDSVCGLSGGSVGKYVGTPHLSLLHSHHRAVDIWAAEKCLQSLADQLNKIARLTSLCLGRGPKEL